MTFDGFQDLRDLEIERVNREKGIKPQWELADEQKKKDYYKIKNVEFYSVFNFKNDRVGDKCLSPEVAKRLFLNGKEKVFCWEDYERKGFNITRVDVRELEKQIRETKEILAHLEKMLK
jgi:hypothetical protein